MKRVTDDELVACVVMLHTVLALRRNGSLVFADHLPEEMVTGFISFLDELRNRLPSVQALRPMLSPKHLAKLEEFIAYGFF